jgi:hypothetical protein
MEQTPLAPGDLRRYSPRPERFHVGHLRPLEGFSGSRWSEIVFRDHRRAFYLFIGVGGHASGLPPALLRALNSLRVGT